MKGLGIAEIRTAVRAPLMNAFAERVIGTLRRECFDHMIVLNERRAQRLLGEFRNWYNQSCGRASVCAFIGPAASTALVDG